MNINRVAICDLRQRDAWFYDWALVIHSYEFSDDLSDVLYEDSCGDMVLCDGSEDKALSFYSQYCKSHGLTLVDYSVLEQEDLKIVKEKNHEQ